MLRQKIYVSLERNIFGSKVNVIQNDSGRTLVCKVANFDLQEKYTAKIYATKPSGLIIYNNCEIDDNEIVVDLTTQMLAEVGEVSCQIQLISDSEVVTSFEFTINVLKNMADSDALESSNEFQAFEQALISANGLETRIDDLEEIADNLGNIGHSNIIDALSPPNGLSAVVADGEANNTNAIAAMVEHLEQSGGYIKLPTGTILANIVIPYDNITISGCGGSTVLMPFNTSLPTIKVTNDDSMVKNVCIENMTLKGLTKGDYFESGIVLNGVRDLKLDFITMYNFETQLKITSHDTFPTSHVFISNCMLYYANTVGVICDSASTTWTTAIYFNQCGIIEGSANANSNSIITSVQIAFSDSYIDTITQNSILLKEYGKLECSNFIIDNDSSYANVVYAEDVDGSDLNYIPDTLIMGSLNCDGYVKFNDGTRIHGGHMTSNYNLSCTDLNVLYELKINQPDSTAQSLIKSVGGKLNFYNTNGINFNSGSYLELSVDYGNGLKFTGVGDNGAWCNYYLLIDDNDLILTNYNANSGNVVINGDAVGYNNSHLVLQETHMWTNYNGQIFIGSTPSATPKHTVSTLVNVPTGSGAWGLPGEYAVDENYLYVCVAESTWKRVAINTW